MHIIWKIIMLMNYIAHWLFLPVWCICCLISRAFPRKIDVGMGPLPLINNVYWTKALRKKGYTVETYVTECYYITKDFDKIYNNGAKKLFFYCPAILFLRNIFRYKCLYVYFNGGPLMLIPGLRLLEPWLYRLAKVKTVVMPYGSDSQVFLRTPNKLTANSLCQDYPDFFRKNQGKIARQINAWCRWADIVVGAMDSVDYLPFWNRIRHCHYAIDTDAIEPHYPDPGKTIRILHAPNHKNIKGSSFIMKAIETLQSEGYAVELIFKQNVPNDVFLKLVAEADIVVDQLIMGWYAMFSMEAMSCGKPVVCYMRDDLVQLYENAGCVKQGEFPFISATPTTITEVLRTLIEEKDKLNEYGRKSRAFVEKYHSLDAVGDFLDEFTRPLVEKNHDVK